LEIISFGVKSEEFVRKIIRIFRLIKSPEIRYIAYTPPGTKKNLLYILVNIGTNYFFSLDFSDGKITDLPVSSEIGTSPSFQRLNDKFLISIGGVNSDTVNLFDLHLSRWYFVGRLSTIRQGSYALLSESDNEVYICGGMTTEGDNTLEIEYFLLERYNEKLFSLMSTNMSMPNVGSFHSLMQNGGGEDAKLQNFSMLKFKKIKDDFLLRKTYPIVIPLFDANTYLICGGQNIFQETNTCTVFYNDKDALYMSNLTLPRAISLHNPNVFFHKQAVYFFSEDDEIHKYCIQNNKFSIIHKEITDL
jgi:hypothetical protein